MAWSERQVAMLHEMGIRVWIPTMDEQGGDVANIVGAASKTRAVDRATVELGPALERSVAAAVMPQPGALRADARPIESHEQRASMVDGLDWPELRTTVAGCVACKLSRTRRQTVLGVGNQRAHWMIVGEAPGEQEDIQGEPFVGKSGQLLDNMLRAIGLTRGESSPAQQVYIANTIKCRPPGNRNPEPDELAKCEPFLIRQLQLVQPRIIVAMGRFAVQSLLRSSEPVGRLRGHVHRYQGVPLIVTYHPAYLLRNPEDKAKAWDDLCLAVETVKAHAAA
jgi:uracil-DNA glycosylase family 4